MQDMQYTKTRFVGPASNPGCTQEQWDKIWLTDEEYEQKYGEKEKHGKSNRSSKAVRK